MPADTIESQIETVSTHLRDACDRLGELLASLRTDTHVSPASMLHAVEDHAQAILSHVWMARWELPFPGDPDEPLDPADPQAMAITRWKEPTSAAD